MQIIYKIIDEDGVVSSVELDELTAAKLNVLPDRPLDYFQIDDATFFLEVHLLVNSRAREKGIINANDFMGQAAMGFKEKRKPIKVERSAKGHWMVVDGNSTVINAIASGWSAIPCCMAQTESQASSTVIP